MSGRVLLDTNIIIALLAGDRNVLQRLGRVDEVFLPCVALGELYYGASKSARAQENINRIDALAADNIVLSCDTITAHRYGDVKNTLRAKGRPLPENDIWIAAIALQHGLTVASRDQHFQEVEGLSIVSW